MFRFVVSFKENPQSSGQVCGFNLWNEHQIVAEILVYI